MKFTRLVAPNYLVFLIPLALLAAPQGVRGEQDGWTQTTVLPPPNSTSGSASAEEIWPVVTAMAAHPTRPYLATAGDNHLIHLWLLPEGKLLRVFQGHGDWVESLTFTPGGEQLISAGKAGRILVWDTSPREEGDRVADPEQFEALTEAPIRELADLEFAIAQIRLSRDGRLLAVTGFGQRKIPVFELTSGKLWQEYSCPCVDMRSVTFSPDGQWIAGAGRNGKIRVMRVDDGTTVLEYTGHRRRVRTLEFAPDGRELISSSEDGSVLLRSLDPLESQRLDDGRTAVGEIGEPLPSDTTPLGNPAEYRLRCRGMKILSMTQLDEHRIALGGTDNSIRIFNRQTQQEEARLQGHDGSVAELLVLQGQLVSSSFDTTIRLWESKTITGR